MEVRIWYVRRNKGKFNAVRIDYLSGTCIKNKGDWVKIEKGDEYRKKAKISDQYEINELSDLLNENKN